MGALLWQARDRALLFENLPGYPGWRCLGQAPADVTLAPVAFGTQRDEMVPEFVRRTEKLGTTRMVDSGPVKERILTGADVDITKMPIHQAGIRDGGPFIGSGLMITKNPETGRRNLSFHRLQMKGPNKTGILLYPRHAWINYQMYEAMDKPMPVAIMIGHHPMYYMAAATTTQYGVDELEIASALLREEVELVKCRTVDLEAPAFAEIILEGEIPPKVREPEGPFSEFQDYYLTGSGTNPIVNIKAVTMRHDAIFKNIQNGTEVEGCVYHKVPMSAQILRRARTVGGFADVKNVLVMPGIFGVVVQMTPRYYGEARNVLDVGAFQRVPASEGRHRRGRRCRYFQLRGGALGDQHESESAGRHRRHRRREDSRHGPFMPGVRSSGRAGLAPHRRQDDDRRRPSRRNAIPNAATNSNGCGQWAGRRCGWKISYRRVRRRCGTSRKYREREMSVQGSTFKVETEIALIEHP